MILSSHCRDRDTRQRTNDSLAYRRYISLLNRTAAGWQDEAARQEDTDKNILVLSVVLSLLPVSDVTLRKHLNSIYLPYRLSSYAGFTNMGTLFDDLSPNFCFFFFHFLVRQASRYRRRAYVLPSAQITGERGDFPHAVVDPM